jgi:hypothetical protein
MLSFLSGALARPVETYPATFNKGSFFDHYPYFLPNAFTALVGLVALVLAYCYLPETLIPHEEEEEECVAKSGSDMHVEVDTEDGGIELLETGKAPAATSPGKGSGAGGEKTKRVPTSFRELLQYPNVGHYVLGYFSVSLLAVLYDEVVPLWCLSSIHRGGLEYTSREVRLFLCPCHCPCCGASHC